MSEPEDPNLIEKYHNAPESGVVESPTIMAMGVGGGGCNAVEYMHRQGVRGVDFVVLNTDRQALEPLSVSTKVLLGPQLCGGLGAGGKPEVGEQAALESVPEIEKLLTPNVKMVFVTAGMGGGTGTGGAPVVASVAKKKGILTVGIVTIPFFFEGMTKITSAIDGAARLQENVDAMLVINNDKLGSIYPDLDWDVAFSKADDILTTASRTISDMVTNLAKVNIDMRDVDTCLRGRTALISVGYGEGQRGERMSQAIRNALHSPLLCDTDIMSAKELLFAFYISHDIEPSFTVNEASEANQLVAEINKHVHIKFGWGYDDTLGNKIKFTILASGFDVSVDSGGSTIKIIPGREQEQRKELDSGIDNRIAQMYGKDKVEDFTRRQETQNYYVLTPEQLDDDAAIEMVERSPAFRRDKRRSGVPLAGKPEEPRGAEQPTKNTDSANQIFFSADDR